MVTSVSPEISSEPSLSAAAMTSGAARMPEVDPMFAYADAAIEHALAALEDVSGELIGTAGTLDRARARLVGEPSSFATLCANAGATEAATELLALVVAVEVDAARAARVAVLDGSVRGARLSLGAAARLLGDVSRCAAAIGPGSALLRAALVDLSEEGTWAATRIRLAPSLVWALAGDAAPDPDLPLGSHWATGDAAAEQAPGLVLVTGPDRVRRRELGMRHCPVGSVLVSPAPADGAGWAALVREATIAGAGIVLELEEGLPEPGRRWIERATHLRWVVTGRDELMLTEMPARHRIELTATGDMVDEDEWREVLGDVPHTHRLNATQLDQVRRTLPAVGGDVDAAVRRLLGGPLARLAHRVRPRKTWDDLVLSGAKSAQLRAVVGRYRHGPTVYDEWGVTTASGRGVVALFTGPSGTGKTLAAEVVAHDLDLDLYRVDLSTVVSKYIGETEQNLDRLFDAASAGNAVLFFDEADSVFGKRAEVKDARDRYANLEVSYLLQRLEEYDGVVVLATNLPGNIDEAFLRRIHEVVHFTEPSVDERRAIWQRHLADGRMPVDEIDVGGLASRFDLTGGQIRNIVLAAAFRAVDEGTGVSLTHVNAAIAGELRKLGRMVKTEDFDE
ncbi:ATP-binding protein [Nocardioides carbamazepini]|uniref:ATP-binding protein n=1 Tax=Nocardioides carbamazepini TaxID=2854259 RepID=UPI002149FB9A|nr:ATP-binding protein [Nocardioides carbamazepini]MCR1782752.1 ATP-binding protein [Nocardioides carbamazepini]